MDELIDFLVKARRVTYAIPQGTPLEDGTEEMVYNQGEWRYQNRYAGQNPYGGQEMIWHKGQVIWIKNYIAEVVSDSRTMAEIYDFQREVLGQPDKEHLMRGPARYVSGQYSYTNSIKGDLHYFTGFEQIFYSREAVYRMTFHGGSIQHAGD